MGRNGEIDAAPPSSVLQFAWNRYLHQLDKKPLRTKALTAAGLAGASDLVAQRISNSASPINWRRTALMAVFGLVWSGPSNHYWQQFLERTFKGRKDAATVVEKVIVDQLVYGPLCNILLMSYISMVVEGKSVEATNLKLRNDYPGIQLHGWKLWPLASLINYRFVPVKLRVLFVNCVAFLWSTFLIVQARRVVPLLTKRE